MSTKTTSWRDKENKLREECISFIKEHVYDADECYDFDYFNPIYIGGLLVKSVYINTEENLEFEREDYSEIEVDDVSTSELVEFTENFSKILNKPLMTNAEKAKYIIDDTRGSLISFEAGGEINTVRMTIDLSKIPADVLEKIVTIEE